MKRSFTLESTFAYICVVLGLCASCASLASAENLDIQAQKVFADEKKGVTIATGKVKMIKGEDKLNADEVRIYVNKARKPLKFEAIGNVDFLLLTQDGRRLKGKSDTLIYLVQANEYQLIGRAQVQEIGKPNFLRGEKITLNNDNNFANVESSSSAPVRVIIDLNDMQSNQNSPQNSSQNNPKNKQLESKSKQVDSILDPKPESKELESTPLDSSE
ncbi:lipopolysaccharide transport periplasmic protein LptA [Helicobacter canis]|uniref:lipopolysaccharide transport periplasmic protein LptA n=1 Tax=Helicobacter canis TaxID=29419 RepID=UPI0026F20141|nr:lipopolysaccharide transport periplasmic protein LptA [Helicobacter canis]